MIASFAESLSAAVSHPIRGAVTPENALNANFVSSAFNESRFEMLF
jgi:hypothetical protein